jgi:MFS transporter, DHA1 family, solute carrier family 18 (vesicular amine transporter), member 1/2
MTANLVLPFFPELIVSISGNSTDIGIIMSLNAFGDIIGGIGFGFLGTKSNSHKLLLLVGLAMSFFPNLLMSGYQTYWTLAAGRFLQGVASGSVWGSGLALLAETEGKEGSGSSLAWVYSSSNFGGLLAPIVAGYLYNFHPSVPFLLLALLCFLQFSMVAVIFKPKNKCEKISSDETSSVVALFENEQEPSLPVPTTQTPVLDLLKNSKLIIILVFTLAIITIGTAMFVVLVIQLSMFYNLPAEQIALCFIAIAPPQFLACIIAGFMYDRFGARYTVLISLLLTTVSSFCLIIPMPLIPFLTFMAIFLSATGILVTPILPEIAMVVPEESSALAFSMFNIAASAGMMFGPVLGSFMVTILGFGTFMFSIGVLRVMMMGLTFLYQSPKEEEVRSIIVV